MCDSYFGVDQDPTFSVEAAEGMEEDDEDDEEWAMKIRLYCGGVDTSP